VVNFGGYVYGAGHRQVKAADGKLPIENGSMEGTLTSPRGLESSQLCYLTDVRHISTQGE